MIPLPSGQGVRVWIATGYTDMRCGFPSLALRVQACNTTTCLAPSVVPLGPATR